ncbi:MAG: flagellar filament capping protein FliD [Butyrivibrio sp.]|nr:flagellar filament capping protein FliD [Butyrivibrio sp.]
MGINVNMDYSTLFSSLNSSSSTDYTSSLSGLLSEYNGIRNGSYSKLVKAYYQKIDNESSDDTSDTEETNSTSALNNSAQETASKIASSAKELSDSADALKSSGSDSVFKKKFIQTTNADGTTESGYNYDTSAITKAVKNFVSDYNSLVKSSSDSTDSTTITRTSFLKNITNNYSDGLSQIGITVNDNGTLTLDSDKLSSSNMEAIAALFTGSNGYASQVSTYASLIENSASLSTTGSAYNSTGAYTASGYSSITDLFT